MDPAPLLSDEAFARRIAIALLRDREGAEDLVQEAWLSVLEKPPREITSPRGYMALLLRRLSFRKRREERRRTTRERTLARDEAQPDTSALVARAEIHGRTVAAVLALEEPYRSTVLRRFFDDRTPAEIAALDGVPLETARTRLKRGLAMLRARLESEGRDWREEWAVAIAGAGSWPEPEPVLSSPLVWGGTAGVLAALVVWFALPEIHTRERAMDAAQEGVVRLEPAETTEFASSALRERVEPGAVAVPAAAPVEPQLSGRVRDEQGRPLADVHVNLAITRFGFGDDLSLATSDENGSFACSLVGWSELSPVSRGLLGLEVKAWTSGHAPLVQEVRIDPDGRCEDVELVLVSGRLLSGRVLDLAGGPVGSAGVTVRTTSRDGRMRAHELMDPTDREGWFAFSLEDGERVTEVMVSSPTQGFAHASAEVLPQDTSGDVTLAALVIQRGHVLRGRCVHPDGTPARSLSLFVRQVEPDESGAYRTVKGSGAELDDGLTRLAVTTDELGRFEAVGLGAALFQVFDTSGVLGDGAVWRPDADEVEIVITRRQLRLEVADPTGAPLEEARLAVTRLSSSSEAAGGPVRTATYGTPPVARMTVTPGETLAVLAFAPGCAVLEESFVVPDDTYEPELHLRLTPLDRSATLVLRPSAGPLSGWRVALRAPLSGTLLPGFQGLITDAEGRVQGLPVGSYRLRIEPPTSERTVPEWCGLETDVPFVLKPGETRLEFPVVPAARLRILFEGESPDATSLTPVEDLEGEGASADRFAWMGLGMLGRLGTLELRTLGNEAAGLLRRVTDLRPEAGQFLELVVPALPARVHITLPGRDPFERELFPAAGEALEVSFSMAETPTQR